jgi:hypothetical protein
MAALMALSWPSHGPLMAHSWLQAYPTAAGAPNHNPRCSHPHPCNQSCLSPPLSTRTRSQSTHPRLLLLVQAAPPATPFPHPARPDCSTLTSLPCPPHLSACPPATLPPTPGSLITTLPGPPASSSSSPTRCHRVALLPRSTHSQSPARALAEHSLSPPLVILLPSLRPLHIAIDTS